MKFILNLTLREFRSSWRQLLFFFLCIAVGVGSVVALRSLVQNLTLSVGGDARELLTADFVINSSNAFSPDEIVKIESVITGSTIVEARNEVLEVSVIARPVSGNDKMSFVSLKGIESPFPLVGKFTLSGGRPFDYKTIEGQGAVVAPILLEQLNVGIGDKIRIGETELIIRDTFDEEPGGNTGFRLGPRVFVDTKTFDTAGLTRTTGRLRRRILYRTSENPTELVDQLREVLRGTTLTIQTYRETQENLNQQFQRTEDYLALSGLLILVLGGIGVWNVARSFVEQKRKSVAVLKCLGAGGTRIITVYLLQILALGFIGSLFGIILAQLTMWFIKFRFVEELPKTMGYGVHFSTAGQGLLLGLMISLLFSALPLLQIRTIKPNLLLRDDSGVSMRRLDPAKWIVGLLSFAGIIALAAWQAGSFKIGMYFIVGLVITTAVLYSAATVLTRILRSFKNFSSFAFSQAINSLYRPGNQTRIILLAVGLGAFVILSVQSLEANLIREFDFSRQENVPSMFFVDIQRSQIEGLKQYIFEKTGENAESIPTVRSRIALINGEPIDFQDREVRQQQGQIGREFAITYRAEKEENEKIVDGEWWPAGVSSDEPEVSINESWSRRLDVEVGDTITFDISGRKITARIVNIRDIDFGNSRTAFIFVFRPGTLEKAPQTFVATTMKRIPEVKRAQLKNAILDKYPSIQIFDVMDIAVVVQKLINNFVIAISFVGSFIFLSGILILIGSIALTKSQRVYENAVLKTLGANRRTLALILIGEYGLLGFLSGLIGSGFASILSYMVSEYLLEIAWELNFTLMALGILATTVLVMVVGSLASFGVLFRKPLATLRTQ